MTPLPHHPSVAPSCPECHAHTVEQSAGNWRLCTSCHFSWLASSPLRPAPFQLVEPILPEFEDIKAEMDARAAVVDAAVAETVAEQDSVRATTAALNAPNRSAALRTATDAAHAAFAAKQARRDAVQRLLQHRQGHQ